MNVKVGIAGLGDMGGGMMDRLLGANAPAYGWNRTRSKAQPYADRGMHLAQSPRELAQASDVTISIVTDDAALFKIAEGEDGLLAGLSPGKIWLDFSTVSPEAIRELEERTAQKKAALVDGSVLGSPQMVKQGTLLMLVAGEQSACDRVREAIAPIGENVRRVGDVGHAKVMKIALNLNLPVQILALSEGMLLAEKNGIDRKVALDIMLGGAVASPMLKYRAPFIVDPPEKAWFDMKMMQKDVHLALELGRRSAMPLPTTSVANDMLSAARAQGLEDRDFAELFHALARMAGVES